MIGKAYQLLSPQVEKLVRSINVNIYTMDEYLSSHPICPNIFEFYKKHYSGFYIPNTDSILINADKPIWETSYDTVALHEIGHWTGHSTRMNRHRIVRVEEVDTFAAKTANPAREETIDEEYQRIRDFQHEEAVAQMIMYLVGLELELDQKYLTVELNRYLGNFTFIDDPDRVTKESIEAADFVKVISSQYRKVA